MSKTKKITTKADEERYSLYERTRDATIIVARKNRKLYDFITYMGMLGTLVCLLFGQIRFAFVCMLLTLLAMNISLISRTKEGILESMVSEDQMENFFNRQKWNKDSLLFGINTFFISSSSLWPYSLYPHFGFFLVSLLSLALSYLRKAKSRLMLLIETKGALIFGRWTSLRNTTNTWLRSTHHLSPRITISLTDLTLIAL